VRRVLLEGEQGLVEFSEEGEAFSAEGVDLQPIRPERRRLVKLGQRLGEVARLQMRLPGSHAAHRAIRCLPKPCQRLGGVAHVKVSQTKLEARRRGVALAALGLVLKIVEQLNESMQRFVGRERRAG
jgi:hypothetical protein